MPTAQRAEVVDLDGRRGLRWEDSPTIWPDREGKHTIYTQPDGTTATKRAPEDR